MQLMIVEHKEKGQGITVDRIAQFTTDGYHALIGVTYFEHPCPVIHYEDPADLTHIDFLESVDELEDDETEEGETE